MDEPRTERFKKVNFWEILFQMRDKDRANKKNALVNVFGDELPWEINRQGMMRWYMHPAMDDTVINLFMIYVQKIPPGSRSGRLKVQGSQIFYVWEGKGYTVMDGIKHYWEKDDLIQIPLRPKGVIYQHFNGDPNNPVQLLSVEQNSVAPLGLDRGCGFEQLENCPEYEEEKKKSRKE